MNSNHALFNIPEILSKASTDNAKNLADIDLCALKSLIEENSKLLDKYISELRD